MLWFDFLALSTLFFLNFRPKGRQICLRKITTAMRAATRKIAITAIRIGMTVGDSDIGTGSADVGILTASVVTSGGGLVGDFDPSGPST